MLSRALSQNPDLTHLHLHTGQHYSPKMAQIFFDELDYRPDYDLGIGSGSHARQTGEAMMGIEQVLIKEKPDLVIVYGDTNATLAGTLAAVKLHLPVAHVEAGLRSFNRLMPEEINRIVSDAISDLLFCPTPTAVENLNREGRVGGVIHTGDILLDTLQFFLPKARELSDVIKRFKLTNESFWLLTMHRPANVDEGKTLCSIIGALSSNDYPRIIFPCHPRTAKNLGRLSDSDFGKIDLIPPVSYFDMLILEDNAELILTDSGGVQREAYFLARPCLTLRSETEWPETLEGGLNQLVGTDPQTIVKGIKETAFNPRMPDLEVFGSGQATSRMASQIVNILKR